MNDKLLCIKTWVYKHYRSEQSLRRSHFALWTMGFGGTALTLAWSVMLIWIKSLNKIFEFEMILHMLDKHFWNLYFGLGKRLK